jgi:hypothetical protein
MGIDVTLVLAVLSAALVLLGVAMWLKQESERKYLPPRYKIPSAVYRLLERARERLFQGSRRVRLTIFRPDPDQPALLRPIARVGWGRPSAASKAAFRLGEGLAGKAAQYNRDILVARIGHFGDPEKARAAHQQMFTLSDEAASNLSTSQLQSEVLIARSLMQGSAFKGVLCIDSLDSAMVPLDGNSEFWGEVDKLAAELARLIPAPQPQTVDQRELVALEGASLQQVRIRVSEFEAEQRSLAFTRGPGAQSEASGRGVAVAAR